MQHLAIDAVPVPQHPLGIARCGPRPAPRGSRSSCIRLPPSPISGATVTPKPSSAPAPQGRGMPVRLAKAEIGAHRDIPDAQPGPAPRARNRRAQGPPNAPRQKAVRKGDRRQPHSRLARDPAFISRKAERRGQRIRADAARGDDAKRRIAGGARHRSPNGGPQMHAVEIAHGNAGSAGLGRQASQS